MNPSRSRLVDRAFRRSNHVEVCPWSGGALLVPFANTSFRAQTDYTESRRSYA